MYSCVFNVYSAVIRVVNFKYYSNEKLYAQYCSTALQLSTQTLKDALHLNLRHGRIKMLTVFIFFIRFLNIKNVYMSCIFFDA